LLGLVLLPAASRADPPWHLEPDPVRLPRPPELEPGVAFWRFVFTQCSWDQTIIHDADHPEIVYEILDTSQARSERQRRRMVQAARDRYRRILRSLAVKSPRRWNREERRVARLFEAVPEARFSRAAYRVRAQRGMREAFRAGLERAGRWQAEMMRIFAGYGVPPQIAVLPHVESSFNPDAHSRAGAVGVWQFTRSTGRLYLRVGYDLDERRDVLASTHAAARHLRDNYRRLGSWPLAIIAYNHGPRGVERAVEKLGTRDVVEILRRYRSRTFGFASRNFYLEFLAALEIAMDPERFFDDLDYEEPEPTRVFVLPQYANLRAVARAFGLSLSEMRVLNPALGRSFWVGQRALPKGYSLRIPVATPQDPWEAFASIPEDSRWDTPPRPPTYRVRRGDTLLAISRRFGIPLRELKAANGIRGDRIYAGQTLLLPDGIPRR
jgi:membrane-bound lytic murein transglycosylase D